MSVLLSDLTVSTWRAGAESETLSAKLQPLCGIKRQLSGSHSLLAACTVNLCIYSITEEQQSPESEVACSIDVACKNVFRKSDISAQVNYT